MTGIAFANGDSSIQCEDGERGDLCNPDPERWNWNLPTIQVTSSTSNSKVFVEGKAVVVEGDEMDEHPDGDPCVEEPVLHSPATSLAAARVTIGGKYAMRVGGKFNKGTPFDHTIITGSSKVTVGGPDISV
jgi:uncharacterized Zn-binding protein involved in type VI secretion